MQEDDRIFPDDGDRLMSLDEVQARLRSSLPVVKDLVDLELLPALRFGRNRRVRKIALNDFLEKYDGQDIYGLIDRIKADRGMG